MIQKASLLLLIYNQDPIKNQEVSKCYLSTALVIIFYFEAFRLVMEKSSPLPSISPPFVTRFFPFLLTGCRHLAASLAHSAISIIVLSNPTSANLAAAGDTL
jgi:hypothetical protein